MASLKFETEDSFIADLPNKRTLIVDDSEDARLHLSFALLELGISRVQQAATVADAKALMAESYKSGDPFYLVLCDHHMPGEEGDAFVRFIRNDPRFAGVSCIAVTSNSDRSLVINYLKAGADSFIIKPAEKFDLATRIRAVWQKHGVIK